jgi:hypothetical protein
MEGGLEALKQTEITSDRPGIDQRHEELGIVDFQACELVNLANLVADDETGIPQGVQDKAEEPFLGGTEMAAEEHQQVDVGVKAQLPPAVAADGDHGHRLFGAGRGGQELAEQRIEAFGVAGERGTPAVAEKDVVAQLAAGFLQE